MENVVITIIDKKMKKEENTTKIGKFCLSCLCGKHSKESNCEVYLRNHGRWTKKIEDKRLKEMYNWLKENEPELYKRVLKKLKTT